MSEYYCSDRNTCDAVVTVVCMTYNHEKYIAKALDGFVNQKTTFKYEIIVHDDASTDRTAEIVSEYEKKYDNIIFIRQKENAYSRKIKIFFQYIKPIVHGEFIAYCEGDDYWIDDHKLQKQYDLMMAHPEVDMCSHAAYTQTGDKFTGEICPSKEPTVLTPNQVILGGGRYLATSSLFYRREIAFGTPRFRQITRIDYSLQIYGSLKGGIAYISDFMSVYRLQSSEIAWTVVQRKNPEKRIAHHKNIIKMLEALNEDTGNLYDAEIKEKINQIEFDILWSNKDYKGMVKKQYAKQLAKKSKKTRMAIRLGVFFPSLAGKLFNRKR